MNLIPGNTLLDTKLILKKAKLKEGMRVADLGCGGLAYFTFPISELVGDKGIVYAVDVFKKSLESLKKRISQEHMHNIKTVWSDIEVFQATKIESSTLDAVFLLNTLHQLKNKKEAIRESIRLIKKGGRLMIVDWSHDKAMGPNRESMVDKDTLLIIVQKMGLNLVEEFVPGKDHFGLIFDKS